MLAALVPFQSASEPDNKPYTGYPCIRTWVNGASPAGGSVRVPGALATFQSLSDSDPDRSSATAAEAPTLPPSFAAPLPSYVELLGAMGESCKLPFAVVKSGAEGGSARTCMEDVTSCTKRRTAATMPNSTATATSCNGVMGLNKSTILKDSRDEEEQVQDL